MGACQSDHRVQGLGEEQDRQGSISEIQNPFSPRRSTAQDPRMFEPSNQGRSRVSSVSQSRQLSQLNSNQVRSRAVKVKGSNPFFDFTSTEGVSNQILSNYRFHSNYNDTFLGKCSILEQKSTGNLYLCKDFNYSDQDKMRSHLKEFEARRDLLVSENVIQIKEVVVQTTDGFFSEKKKVILIIDYPFVNFSTEISNRIKNRIAFTKDEVFNFINSTTNGYVSIESAGYKTDKVRLRNIFIGIKNRESLIKVAETNLITPLSNFQSMVQHGSNTSATKDIYLSPEQFSAFKAGNEDFECHRNSGVFSLAMCILDITVMDPSRQAYYHSEKQIDYLEIKSRVEITGKKYGDQLESLLNGMLVIDPQARLSFPEVGDKLSAITKNLVDSQIRLSVIPSQQTSYIHNDTSKMSSSKMFKSIVSQTPLGSRVYSSKFKNKRQESELDQVIEHYTNGNRYMGQKKGDVKHGKGKYEFKDNSYYEGEWVDNKMCGVGNLYFEDGSLEYAGEWRNDEFNGWGTLTSREGVWQKYQGEFKNGVKEGRGKMEFRNGIIYDGEFKGDKISGRGRRIQQDGEATEQYWATMSPENFSRLL